MFLTLIACSLILFADHKASRHIQTLNHFLNLIPEYMNISFRIGRGTIIPLSTTTEKGELVPIFITSLMHRTPKFLNLVLTFVTGLCFELSSQPSKGYGFVLLYLISTLRLLLTYTICLCTLKVFSSICAGAYISSKLLMDQCYGCSHSKEISEKNSFGIRRIHGSRLRDDSNSIIDLALQKREALIHNKNLLNINANVSVFCVSVLGNTDISEKKMRTGGRDFSSRVEQSSKEYQALYRSREISRPILPSTLTNQRSQQLDSGQNDTVQSFQSMNIRIPPQMSSISSVSSDTRTYCSQTMNSHASQGTDKSSINDTSLNTSYEKLSTGGLESIWQSKKNGDLMDSRAGSNSLDRVRSQQVFMINTKYQPTKQDARIVKGLLPLSPSLWISYSCAKKGIYDSNPRFCNKSGKAITIDIFPRYYSRALRCARSVAVMKALDHPNIIRLYSASRWLKSIFTAEERLDGGTLSCLKWDRHSMNNPVPESFISTVMREVLKGIAYMHQQDYAHCGIRPGAIFMSKKGEIKIGGFSSAKDIRIGYNVQKRKNEYISPESSQATDLISSDIWGVAYTAIDLFTGRWPFNSRNSESTLQSFLTNPALASASSEFREFLLLASQLKHRKSAAQELLETQFVKNAPPTGVLIPKILKENP